MNKKAIITQSNYIPWKGYFDAIAAVDVFVVYDEMQYTKRDWRNRNMIKTPQGNKWLSIPVEVKGKYFQKINETKVSDKNWTASHWNLLKQNYKDSSHFKEMAEWIEPLYRNCKFDYLSEINIHFIREINKFLEIDTEIVFSKDLNLAEGKTEKLVKICKDLGVNQYFSGPAARNYMDEGLFKQEKVDVAYWDYTNYPEYDQLYGEFEHGVTIFDLIFNKGNSAANYLKFCSSKV